MTPPGALFQVFGFAAVASVPAGPDDVGAAVVVASASALFAIGVGSLGPLVRRARRTANPPAPELPIGGSSGATWRHAAHSGVSVLVAGLVATGTFVGLGAAWLLLDLDLGDSAVVVVVATLQLTTELVVGRNYALALICITPLALLIVHLAAPVIPIGELLVDRGSETVIGVSIGLLVGYATRPRPAAG